MPLLVLTQQKTRQHALFRVFFTNMGNSAYMYEPYQTDVSISNTLAKVMPVAEILERLTTREDNGGPLRKSG